MALAERQGASTLDARRTTGPVGAAGVEPEPFGSGPIQSCSRCGRSGLDAYSDGDITIFGCRDCRSRWHISLGWLCELPTLEPNDGTPSSNRRGPAWSEQCPCSARR